MSPTDPAAVRLLAAWLHRRRALSEQVEGLLLHGPSAVERVCARSEELRAGYAAELEALDALLRHARQDVPAARPGEPAPYVPPAPPAPATPRPPRLRSVAPDERTGPGAR